MFGGVIFLVLKLLFFRKFLVLNYSLYFLNNNSYKYQIKHTKNIHDLLKLLQIKCRKHIKKDDYKIRDK